MTLDCPTECPTDAQLCPIGSARKMGRRVPNTPTPPLGGGCWALPPPSPVSPNRNKSKSSRALAARTARAILALATFWLFLGGSLHWNG